MLRPDFQNTDIELGRSGSASLVNNYALVWAPRLRMCRGFSTRDCREGHLVRAHACGRSTMGPTAQVNPCGHFKGELKSGMTGWSLACGQDTPLAAL